MKIIIIGAGFTGLAAAWDLNRQGHEVEIYEASDKPGGLARGFKNKGWQWALEEHYHHIFASDAAILGLVKDMGLSHLVFFRQTQTKILSQGQIYPLDSPLTVLKFPLLPHLDRVRLGVVLLLFKLLPDWRIVEKYSAESLLIKLMGQKTYNLIWRPLFQGKFGHYAPIVNAAWFWARIKARTKALGYFEGGFGRLAEAMVQKLTQAGVVVKLSTPIDAIIPHQKGLALSIKEKVVMADKFLVTAPAPGFLTLFKSTSASYQKSLKRLKGLAAQTLILELDKSFFTDGTYWLNINEPDWPILAVVEHTNFIKAENYGGRHLVYVGKYLDATAPEFSLDKVELLTLYHPYLEKLSPGYQKNLIKTWLFKAPFAQPIVPKNHSRYVPDVVTPHPDLFWASMQHVYPWDRGTNFAVALGRQVAQKINETI